MGVEDPPTAVKGSGRSWSELPLLPQFNLTLGLIWWAVLPYPYHPFAGFILVSLHINRASG